MERKQHDLEANDSWESYYQPGEKIRNQDGRHLRRHAPQPVQKETVHGIMIDAGSSGSRLHLYEFEPRVLQSRDELDQAVSGRRLSVPISKSRWTQRLRPGVHRFVVAGGTRNLTQALHDYLNPLVEFATTLLHDKRQDWSQYPIFFRATAGMRMLSLEQRQTMLKIIRNYFANHTEFWFEDEFARVLSGEEEAIFGWAGINFAMGNLVQETEGVGTVLNPSKTYGALDLGGASTQIAFYEPHEDIMANLFKLQIGQAKHWNLYSHSFLYYGLNEARHRFQAILLSSSGEEKIGNPCLPGQSRQLIKGLPPMKWNEDGMEVHRNVSSSSSSVNVTFVNDGPKGNFTQCLAITKQLLHLESNTWCQFAHPHQCSFNGVAMPPLPDSSEFLAFSNYHHIWQFLQLPSRASLQELYEASERICQMSYEELMEYNENNIRSVTEEEAKDFCFRSAYAYTLLSDGYGFSLENTITATNVVNGQKVSWAVGAMLYEINTLPWKIAVADDQLIRLHPFHVHVTGMILVSLVTAFMAWLFCRKQQQHKKYEYEPLKEIPKAGS
mmetsp:Transcript_1421/g.1905  ORF Transcript_1421/g.1905 Transcript_1421/m.1905 type:complete len:555 (+) Transcript_1421:167-1831(+)|eukprot:CAMPEP_0178901832 /NCGR_PEP_ID=MMETSP0786-20121207/4260_1 /TAXON_ID=186022 /ORGANISM="Thalassionema frauenfeldii, Strain CCMP 1798" /LENGTH=554 /DNA_ID=CAMNT_0020573015 /DNA_START=99 /DNA_END=1763 /DNA_ORIENTATION=+